MWLTGRRLTDARTEERSSDVTLPGCPVRSQRVLNEAAARRQ